MKTMSDGVEACANHEVHSVSDIYLDAGTLIFGEYFQSRGARLLHDDIAVPRCALGAKGVCELERVDSCVLRDREWREGVLEVH